MRMMMMVVSACLSWYVASLASAFFELISIIGAYWLHSRQPHLALSWCLLRCRDGGRRGRYYERDRDDDYATRPPSDSR